MQKDPIVITGAARTPIGSLGGCLASLTGPDLGAIAIAAAIDRSVVATNTIDQVLMGCVLSAGIGQAPARQAAISGGIPISASCTTINKICGSGMMAAMLGHDMLLADSCKRVISGGFESMTNAPYLLSKARAGYRLGHETIIDHVLRDGLEDAYEYGKLMGHYAEDCAKKYGFSREDQDEFAIESLTRATEAFESGAFRDEITSVPIRNSKNKNQIMNDEEPLKANIEKIPQLKPAFEENGTITPANASSISDGAAAIVMMRLSDAENGGHVPLAKIIGHSTYSHEPTLFTTTPAWAIKKLLEKVDWSIESVDLFEINEAFAVVAMAAMRDLAIPHEKLNIHGGACALGHPIGASGARIIVTLLHAMERYDLKRGVASVCIGGGESTAMAFEKIK